MEKIVISGASGFIGSHLLDYFLTNFNNYSICVLVRKTSKIIQKKNNFSILETNFFDVKDIEKSIYGVTYFYHVLGATKGNTEEDFVKTNVFITENILKALSNLKTKNKLDNFKRFLFVSSLAVSGDSLSFKVYKKEEDAYNPIEFYGKSKMLAEKICKKYFNLFPITIVRPSAVLGEGDKDFLKSFTLIKNHLKIFFGNKNKFFSYIYVKDLIKGIVMASFSEKAINNIYFLTNKNIITWETFYKKIAEILDKKCITINIPMFILDIIAFFGEIYSKVFKKKVLFNKQKIKLGKAMHFICSHEKALEDFGFIAKTDIDEALRKTLSYSFKIK